MPPGGAGSPKQRRIRLREFEERLEETKRESDLRDQQIRIHTDALVKSVGLRTKEAQLRDQLSHELSQARARHKQELLEHREQLDFEHAEAAMFHRGRLQEEVELSLQRVAEGAGDPKAMAADQEMHERRSRHAAEIQESQRERIMGEERRVARAMQQLMQAQAEARALTQERDCEFEAARAARGALLNEQRAIHNRRENLAAEVREQVSLTEGLHQDHTRLEGNVRSLQNELTRATYGIGQRDHELKAKDSELHEVRQVIATIQEEMDEVNTELRDACGRVHRVENSARCERDLGEKVQAMRTMVKESNSALSQLCAALEQERVQNERTGDGLKQQRVRTELLLQLLQHFKSRTHDLAPQTLLRLNEQFNFSPGGPNSSPAGVNFSPPRTNFSPNGGGSPYGTRFGDFPAAGSSSNAPPFHFGRHYG